MFGNYQELPPDFIIRRIRHSDIFDVMKFIYDSSNSTQNNQPSIQTDYLIGSTVAFGLLFIIFSFITGSFFNALSYLIPCTIACIIITLIIIYFKCVNIINSGECFAVYNQNKICGIIAASNYDNYAYIEELIVSNLYRRRGLGTYLINRIKQNLDYPIYLLCFPEPYLVEFYSSNGFVAIEDNELPKRIREYLDNFNQVKSNEAAPFIPMILEENL